MPAYSAHAGILALPGERVGGYKGGRGGRSPHNAMQMCIFHGK